MFTYARGMISGFSSKTILSACTSNIFIPSGNTSLQTSNILPIAGKARSFGKVNGML
jgi:hypothetical protein